MPVYTRLQDETDEELIYRICSEKDQIGSWQDVANILNILLGTEYTESKYRKQYHAFERLVLQNKNSSESSELEVKIRELHRKQVKYQDERNAWSRQNYIEARVEQKLDSLESNLKSLGRVNFPTTTPVRFNSDNDMLVILSDFHIGQTFSSTFGEYNSDIAFDRLQKFLSSIIEIQKLHKSQKCYVSLQGDLISGNIHKSIQVTNRENVIQQIKIATELISSFCYELSLIFTNVFMFSVCGNHTRIDRKEDQIHDERLDDIISWGVGLSLSHIDNFIVLNRNIDSGIAEVSIRGKSYCSVHGDFDSFNKTGCANLCMMLGYMPYAILFGHLHTCALDEVNGVKIIRGGSLSGCGDQYTLEKRLSGRPSQMVCICDESGVKAYYPIDLS